MTQQPGTQRQNIEQQRGKEAWEDIRGIKKLSETEEDEKWKKEYDKLQKEYRSLARGLNAMIQINGLGQTLGFLKAKSKKEIKDERQTKNAHFQLLGHLTHWMHGHFDTVNNQPNPNIVDTTDDKIDGLLEWVTETATSADYRRATTECLAFGIWLRRFAEAELKEPDTGEE